MDRYPNQLDSDRIAFIGNYLPRQCGIATFTTDLCEAVAAEHPGTTCIARAGKRHRSRLCLPVRGAFRIDREGHRVLSARRRFLEYQ